MFEFPSYNEVKDALSDVQKSIKDWWDNNIVPWFTADKWCSVFDGIKQGFQKKWQEIKDWWSNTAIVQFFTDIGDWFSEDTWTFSEIADGLKNHLVMQSRAVRVFGTDSLRG